MGKIKKRMSLWMIVVCTLFISPLCAKAEEISVELIMEYESIVFNGVETQGEYGIVHGKNSAGEILWEVKTDTYPRAQYEAVTEICRRDSRYYYEEGGTLKVLDVKNGKVQWEVPECGAISGYDFGSDDTFYFCSYEGPHFAVIDRNGHVLKRIDSMDGNIYWPYEIECRDAEAAVVFEGCSDSYSRYLDEGIVFLVNLENYSYYMENKEGYSELWKNRYYVNENDMLGTPLKYAYIDMENDGQEEVVICTKNSEGTRGLYLWSRNQGQYTCGSEFENVSNVELPDWELFYSPTYQELVRYSGDQEGETYNFYKNENVSWKLDFSVFSMVQPDKLKSVFFHNNTSEDFQKIAEYNDCEDSQEKENGMAMWESYTGDLVALDFKDFK